MKQHVPDIVFLAGLVLLFIGVGFAYSWPAACIIAGSVLVMIGAAVGIISALAKAKGGP